MSETTRILIQIQHGDKRAAEELLPLVYDELRRLATAQMSRENPGHSLNATALVHEAFLRLIGDQRFDNRQHFFAAAAESMRRILVEHARARCRLKRGGEANRQEYDEELAIADARTDEILAVHEALEDLERHDPQAAALVKLRFFAGFEHQEAADALGISRRSADRLWLLSRTWLYRILKSDEQ